MSTDLPREANPRLDYHATSFSQGRMDFAWEELNPAERQQTYEDWAAGKGLIGGDPRQRPGSEQLPDWGINQPFFRALNLDDERGENGARLRWALASERPLEVEIGFGRGDFLLDRALRYPTKLLIGFETKTKATRLCLQRIQRFQIGNLWLSDDDARFSLPRVLADGRVDVFHVLFPDPWWKEQHKVKRLFSPPFVDLLAEKLHSGGVLHFKSDVQEYGELVRYLVEQQPAFLPHNPLLARQISEHLPTHREFWCTQRGLPINTYYFQRR